MDRITGYVIERAKTDAHGNVEWVFQQIKPERTKAILIAWETGTPGRPCRVRKPETGAILYQSDVDDPPVIVEAVLPGIEL